MKSAAHDEDLKILCETVDRLFAENLDHARVSRAEAGRFDADLWHLVEAAGLPRVHLPVDVGGAGGSWREAGAVLRLAARHAAPLPLAETMVAGWALWRGGLEAPAGPITLAAVEALPREPGKICFTGVPWARDAATLVVVGRLASAAATTDECGSASHSGGANDPDDVGKGAPASGPDHSGDSDKRNVLIGPDRPGDKIHVAMLVKGFVREMLSHLAANIAGEPRDDVTLGGDLEMACKPAILRIDDFWSRLTLARSAQLVGALEGSLELALRYANQRVQFGRPIGHFQAIQQELARFAGQVAAARAALETALDAAARADEAVALALRPSAGHGVCRVALERLRLPEAQEIHAEFERSARALDADDPLLEIATAKIIASDAASIGASIAHQVHGALGFTAEHPLQQLTRRLWSWRGEAGSAADWADLLGAATIAAGPDALWPRLTAR